MNEITVLVDGYYGASVAFRRKNDYSYNPKCNSVNFRMAENDAIEVLVNGRLVAVVLPEMTGDDAVIVMGA